jgi:hypothetical protein
LIRLESVGLTAGAVERQHELAAQPLAQRVGGDVGVELRHEVGAAAELEIRVDPLLDRGEPELVETSRLAPRERLVGEVGERRPAPEGERARKGLRPLRRRQARGALHGALEAHRVDRLRVDSEEIAG